MRHHLIPVLMLAVVPTLGHAGVDLAEALASAQSIKCNFGKGSVTWLKDGKPETTGPAHVEEEILYDSIDPTKSTAREIRNYGARDAFVISSRAGLILISPGWIVTNIVTVLPNFTKEGAFIAINTGSNSAGPGSIQYFGSCRILQ